MRKLFYRAPKARRVRGSLAGFLFVFVLEGENGGQVEVRGVLGVVRPAFASPRVPGQSCSSAVHSPSSRAGVARGKVNFFFEWSPGQQPRAGRVFFVFFFVGATMSTYSAGRSSSGNAQSGDVLPACGSGSSEYSEPLRKVSGRGRSKAAGDME